MIVGIDPSFTGTGLYACNDTVTETYYMEKYSSGVSVYEGHNYGDASAQITDHIFDILIRLADEHSSEKIHIICEIPTLATKSGAYLAVLHGYLDSLFRSAALPIEDYIWIPCTACNSFTKNKERKKSYLVNWVKERHENAPKRLSHDVATGWIFCDLYLAIRAGKYKNQFFIYDR